MGDADKARISVPIAETDKGSSKRSTMTLRTQRGGVLHAQRGPYDDTLERARWLERRLRDMGVRIHGGSRIARYRWVLEELLRVGNGADDPSARFSIRELQQATFEITALWEILSVL